MTQSFSLLSRTLAGEVPPPALALKRTGGTLTGLTEGIVEWQPDTPAGDAPALVLSAGVHGNETAPIELVDQLISELVEGMFAWRVPVLVILGNPEAMRRGTRFVDFNLNRLFMGTWKQRPEPEYETGRARELEQILDDFLQRHPNSVHYDLHTAIRPSAIEKFALYPFVEGRTLSNREAKWLGAAGIEALLLQHAPASTFSAHSSRRWGIESFTVELGKVYPFGQNDLNRLAELKAALKTRLGGGTRVPDTAAIPELYQVKHEILHTGPGFRLHVTPQTPNFTLYDTGTVVWENGSTCWKAPEPLRMVFPNPDVPKGQRAGLLVQSVSVGNEK